MPIKRLSLSFHFKVVDGSEGREVQLINRKSLRSLTSQVLGLLMSQEEEHITYGLKVEVLSQHYLAVHGAPLNPCEYGFLSLSELLKSLPYLVEVCGRVCFFFCTAVTFSLHLALSPSYSIVFLYSHTEAELTVFDLSSSTVVPRRK